MGRSRKPLWPYGPPWVRIPPPPLHFYPQHQEIKKPDESIRQVLILYVSKKDQDFFSPVAFLILKIKPMVNKLAPINKMTNDCNSSGLNMGPITLTLASISS